MTDMGPPVAEKQKGKVELPSPAPSSPPIGEKESATGSRYLVVTIHDVAPPTLPRVRQILSDLEEVGIRRCTLLVVPRFHGEWDLESTPEFRDFLLSRDPERQEICLHGYQHLGRPDDHRGLARLIATRYTDSEGEFYRLQIKRAVPLIERGLEDLARIGIKPRGFIAPAWLHPFALDKELHRLGFLYTVRLWSFILLQPRIVRVWAPALAYSPRRRWRVALSLMWNPAVWRVSRPVKCLRTVIHPCDWEMAVFRRQITGILSAAHQRRVLLTYADLAETLARGSES